MASESATHINVIRFDIPNSFGNRPWDSPGAVGIIDRRWESVQPQELSADHADSADFSRCGKSARQRVHQVIDAEFEGRGSVVEGPAAFIEPFPEFADVVIVVDDHLQIAVGVPETEKLDRALAGEDIRGNHIEGL